MSDVLRRRIAALLLLAGIALGALAIADLGPFEDPVTQEERVESAVEDFFAAAAAGESETFCELLTRDARRSLQVNTAQQLRSNERLSCDEVFAVLHPILFRGSQVDIRLVSVSGLRARVETRLKTKGSPAQPRTVLLTEENGEWHLADLGS